MDIICYFLPQQCSTILIDIPLLAVVLFLLDRNASLLGFTVDLKRKMMMMGDVTILIWLVHPLIIYTHNKSIIVGLEFSQFDLDQQDKAEKMAVLGQKGEFLMFIDSSYTPLCVLVLQLAINEIPEYNSHCLLQHNRYLIHLSASLFFLLLGHYNLLNQTNHRSLHQVSPQLLSVIPQPMQPKPLDDHDLQCEDVAETLIQKPEVERMVVVSYEIMQVDEVELYVGIVVVDDLLNGNVHFLEIAFLLQSTMHDELQQQMFHFLLYPFFTFPFTTPYVFFGRDPQQNILDQFIIRRDIVFITDYLSNIDELIDDDLILKPQQFFVIQGKEVAEIASFPSGPSQAVTAISLEQVVGMREDHIDQIGLGLCLEVVVVLCWIEKLSDELNQEVNGGLEATQSCLFKDDVQIVLAIFYGPQHHLKLYLSAVLSHSLPSLLLHVLVSLQSHASPTISIE